MCAAGIRCQTFDIVQNEKENRFGPIWGDTLGFKLYGIPEEGFWLDNLEIGGRFAFPIFFRLFNLYNEFGEELPKIVMEWSEGIGWTCAEKPHRLSEIEARGFADALRRLLRECDAGGSHHERMELPFVDCVEEVISFIDARIPDGVFIEEL